jgi:hypothetical protein
MLAYLSWRFAVEFIKPREIRVIGLSAIQVASAVGAIVCAVMLLKKASGTAAMSSVDQAARSTVA